MDGSFPLPLKKNLHGMVTGPILKNKWHWYFCVAQRAGALQIHCHTQRGQGPQVFLMPQNHHQAK